MCTPPKKITIINGIRFKDVTDETTINETMNYEEAFAYTERKIICTSNKEIL